MSLLTYSKNRLKNTLDTKHMVDCIFDYFVNFFLALVAESTIYMSEA